ncbi:tRNA (adenosine(37)-N6)-threonylcarbamoyltransferase complex ATPase subunit type 1 TsaE [Candidatus Wolfebacteria bacterium]|nr:tRNA (adenosine(37)-N6)-threonylcarbamoyltransferase complex ATPase subunit type 1 TsaE [Candidatus Wolfebacteria bacterium]
MIKETFSSAETKKLAGSLAKQFLKISSRKKRRGALVFALAGNLGSGKTTFTQGFLRALGVKKKITSPTFVLIKNYELRRRNCGNYKRIYHVDCYRIHGARVLLKLGLKKILEDSRNIVLVEWPEKIKSILPKNSIWIKFEHGEREKVRGIKFLLSR